LKRFFAKINRMPTMWQAGVYSTVMHYLKAIEAAGTNEPLKVAAKREDGLMVHELMLVQVKKAGGFEVPLGLLSESARRMFSKACAVKAPHIASLTTKAFFRKCQNDSGPRHDGSMSHHCAGGAEVPTMDRSTRRGFERQHGCRDASHPRRVSSPPPPAIRSAFPTCRNGFALSAAIATFRRKPGRSGTSCTRTTSADDRNRQDERKERPMRKILKCTDLETAERRTRVSLAVDVLAWDRPSPGVDDAGLVGRAGDQVGAAALPAVIDSHREVLPAKARRAYARPRG
jgi:hypothetical protein